MNEIPEPWASAAEQAGIRQTLRGIAEAARISHVTVGRLIGEGRTSPATITAVATALRVEPAKVYEWAHVEVSDWGPWTAPMLAHRLSPRARAALAELILAIVEEGDGTDVPSTGAREKRPEAVLETARSTQLDQQQQPSGPGPQSASDQHSPDPRQ